MARESLWQELGEKEFRRSFSEALIDDRLSAQIYHLRRHLGWTQKDLADRSGVSAPTISGLENSTTSPSLATLRKIASAFDVALNVRFISFSTLLTSRPAIDAPVLSYESDRSPSSVSAHQPFTVGAGGKSAHIIPNASASTRKGYAYASARTKAPGKASHVN